MADDADLALALAAAADAEARAATLADEVSHLLDELAELERQLYHAQLELDALRT